MSAPLIDLTCGESQSGGSPRPRIKSPRSELPSRPSSTSRSHREHSSASSNISSQGPYSAAQDLHNPLSSSSSASSSFSHSHRRPRDGYDLRRPIMTTRQPQPAAVVDLTGSDDGDDENHSNQVAEDTSDDIQITNVRQAGAGISGLRHSRHSSRRPPPSFRRHPRFPRPIMNDDGESHPPHRHDPSRNHNPHATITLPSHSRTLPPLVHPYRLSSALSLNSYSTSVQRNPEVIEINDDGEDDIGPQSRNIPPIISPFTADNPRPVQHVSRTFALARTGQNHGSLNVFGPFMDYTRTAFNMGHSLTLEHTPPRPPAPAAPSSPPLEPLPPPPKGFTSAPREGDILICPLCKLELCVGEGEGRNQVWVVKACGHVYCGTCAAKRPKSKPKNPRADQFVTCVVPDCKERVTGSKAMYQLFL